MKPVNHPVSPFVKWVGGKRQIMNSIIRLMPDDIERYTYVEPFLGGGAVLFHLKPKTAIINDFNSELINVYKVIRDDTRELIEDLKKHKNNADYFYQIRNLDRTCNYNSLGEIQRASRLLFLNKTCYNGLYRVNQSGEFNSPYGRYKNPNIVNESTLIAVSNYLKSNDIQILNDDFETVLNSLDRNCFVYLDPPYHPISDSSNFTGYTQSGWDASEQERLRNSCDSLTSRGIKFIQSNSDSFFIKTIYKHYTIQTIKATRAINTNAQKRGEINEVLIRNYE